MLKLKESANGKFDIVFSDGFKSQLHSRTEKNVPKAEQSFALDRKTQSVNKTSKSKNKHPQISQRKTIHNEDATRTMPKTKKSSRIAAKFDKTIDDKKISSLAVSKNENASFVTKDDLANLLKALTADNSNKVGSAEVTKQLSSDKESKASPPKSINDHKELGGDAAINTNQSNKQTAQLSRVKSLSKPVPAPTTTLNDKSSGNLSTASVEITKPAAMRSSFAIGAPGVVMNDPHNDKVVKYKLWREELEQQIKEKKENDRQNKAVEANENDRKGNDGSFQQTSRTPVKSLGESSQQEQVERGRGLMSMIETDHGAIQRRKILEHQRAVEQQVEDRRRQKQQERERRLREDALEEARLAKETAELQRQFQEELQKNKEKEEQAKQRAHLLQEEISKACESAQQLKREKRKNRLQNSVADKGDVSSNGSERLKESLKSSLDHQPGNQSRKRDVIPPLKLSHSPPDTYVIQNNNLLSNSTTKKSFERDVKRSYSEPVSLHRSRDFLSKWAQEDVGSTRFFDEKQHVYDENNLLSSDEEQVPFYRTKSATLLSDSVTSQAPNQRKDVKQNSRYDQNKERKVIKKGRVVPEVQPTRTSLLRCGNGTNSDTAKTLSNRRHLKPAELPQKNVQKTTSVATHSIPANESVSVIVGRTSPVEEYNTKTTMNFVANNTPTAHQERILEQLSTLRKGLLMKDQELKARILNMREYEIPT